MKLDISTREIGVETATLISSLGFGIPISKALEDDVMAHLNEGKLYVIRDQNSNQEVGFAVFKTFGDVLYLGGFMLLPEVQGKGIAKDLIELERENVKAKFLALRTQNPKMWSVGRRVCKIWFPHPDQTILPHTQIAAVSNQLGTTLGMVLSTNKAFYGSPLYGKKPMHSDPNIQRWWDNICLFDRGDSVFCVGQF